MFISNNLTDKELLKDLLMSEKDLALSYNNSILESSCPELRKVLTGCLEGTQNTQYSIYSALDKRGWTHFQAANKRDVQSIVDAYSSSIT